MSAALLPSCSSRPTEKEIEALLLSEDSEDNKEINGMPNPQPQPSQQLSPDVDSSNKTMPMRSALEDINSLDSDSKNKTQEVPDAECEVSSSWEPVTHSEWARVGTGSESVEASYSASVSPKERFPRDPGVMGLVNIGNTCFMNAGLQCLLNTPALVEFFLRPKPAYIKISSYLPVLLHRVYAIFSRAWRRTNMPSFNPTSFKECLATHYSQYQDSRQHDCQEFLALLLNLLHEQLQKCQTRAEREFLEEILGTDGKKDEDLEAKRSMSCSGRLGSAHPNWIKGSPEKKKSRTSPTKRGSVSSFPAKVLAGFYRRKKSQVGGFLREKRRKITNCSIPPKSQFYLQYPNFQPRTLPQTYLDSEGEECNSAYYNINREIWERTRAYDQFPRKRPRITSEAKRKLDFELQRLDMNRESTEMSPREGPPEKQMEEQNLNPQKILDILEGKSSKSEQNVTEDPKTIPIPSPNSASKFWNEHFKSNNTVISRTFQGLLQSTVTCTVCPYVSTVHEPFMYLSLPLPDVGSYQRTLSLRLIRLDECPIQCVLFEKHFPLRSTVKDLKSELASLLSANYPIPVNPEKLYLGSVSDFNITEICDDVRIQSIDDRNLLYLYELNSNFDSILAHTHIASTTAAVVEEENWDNIVPRSAQVPTAVKADSSDGGYESSPTETQSLESPKAILPDLNFTPNSPGLGGNSPAYEPWQVMQCRICYENCPLSKMMEHSAGCVFCKDCVQQLHEHTECTDKSFRCPGQQCSGLVRISDFHPYKPEVAMGTLTQVTFRNVMPDSPVSVPFGHPVLIRIPTFLPAKEFHEFLDNINPFPGFSFRVYSSTQDGRCCALCDDIKCQGCTFPVLGNVGLRHGSQLVILYTELEPDLMAKFAPEIMPGISQGSTFGSYYYHYQPTFHIHDCLEEFAKEELLDEDNPWFCPGCKCKRRATKKLSISKFPDYLIIYLKRFVYENLSSQSQKLEHDVIFPLDDLNLSPYMAEEVQGEDKSKYDLYGCVCHEGNISCGHYTAFTKNVVTEEWNYFNDRTAAKEGLNESCYSSAYILFYARQGTQVEIPDPPKSSPLSSPPSPGGVPAGTSCTNSLASSSIHANRYGLSRPSSSQTERSEDDYRTYSCSTSSPTRSVDESSSRGRIRPVQPYQHHIRWDSNGGDEDDSSVGSDGMPPLV